MVRVPPVLVASTILMAQAFHQMIQGGCSSSHHDIQTPASRQEEGEEEGWATMGKATTRKWQLSVPHPFVGIYYFF